MFHSVIFALLIACGDESAEKKEGQTAEVIKQPTVKQKIANFKRQIELGHGDESMKKMLQVLPKQEKNQQFWHLLSYAATTCSDEKTLEAFSKLKLAASEQKNTVEFLLIHSIKGVGEALAFAQKVADKEHSAVLQTYAKIAGAKVTLAVEAQLTARDAAIAKQKQSAAVTDKKSTPADAPPPAPIPEVTISAGDALILLVDAPASRLDKILASAKQNKRSDALALVGQLAAKHGKIDVAKEIHTKIAASKDFGVASKVQLLGIAVESDLAKKTELAEAAVKAAVAAGNISEIDALLAVLAQVYIQQGKTADLWKKVDTLLKIEENRSKGKGDLYGLAAAKVALSIGKISTGHELAKLARTTAKSHSQKDAAFTEAFAAFLMRDVVALEEASKASDEKYQKVLAAFQRSAEGLPMEDNGAALQTLPSEMFITAVLSISETDIAAADALLPLAKKRADEVANPAMQLTIAFAVESVMREGKGMDTSSVLDEIASKYEKRFPNISTELGARRYLLTGSASINVADKAPALVSTWSSFVGGGIPKSQSDIHLPIAGVSLVKQALSSGKGYAKSINAVWQNLPIHRVGPLAAGTVLDGSQGLRLAPIVQAAVGTSTEQNGAAILILQELDRRRANLRLRMNKGFNPTIGLKPENRNKLVDLAATARAGMVSYWLGGVFPEKQLQELRAQEQIMVTGKQADESFQRYALHGKVDLSSLRENLAKMLILSYSYHNDRIIGVVLSPGASAVKDIGSVAEIKELITKQRSLLDSGRTDLTVFKPRSKAHTVGNTLRLKVFNAFEEQLKGYARYVIVGPDELLSFALNTLPEQQQGLRFLGQLRTVTSSTGFNEVLRNANEFASFEPDVLAFGKPQIEASENGDKSTELLTIDQKKMPVAFDLLTYHYRPDIRKLFLGAKAKGDEYAEYAAKARYIYFSDVQAAPDGGFLLADRALSLSEIYQTPLTAQVVFLSAHPDHELQLRRVQAFLNAGARSVLLFTWQLPEKVERRLLDKLFESLNRDDPLFTAVERCREEHTRDQSNKQKVKVGVSMDDVAINNPGVWGAFHIFGRPQ